MRICLDHNTKIKEAISCLGLSQFIATDREQAQAKVALVANGVYSRDSFDPLMGASVAIYLNAEQFPGINKEQLEATDTCPLCLVRDCPCGTPHDSTWIAHAISEQSAVAQRMGLLPVGSVN